MKGWSNKNKLIISLVVFTGILAATIFYTGYRDKRDSEDDLPFVVDTFKNVNLTAESAYVYDIKKNKVIYAKEPERQLPLASLTKIMSAMVALDNSPSDMKVKVADKLLLERGGGDIYANEEWSLHDIIDFALVASSNDAAEAIASAVGSLDENSTDKKEAFVEDMNAKARSLGLMQTYFINPSGLDISPTFSGAYGSARDAARLISYAYLNYPEIMEATAEPKFQVQSLSGLLHNVSNTNEIAASLPGLSASKTGFTDLAGGNLAVVVEAGPSRPIALVVMGSTKDGRFSDINKLYEATLKYINVNYE